MIAAIADTHTAVWYVFADARLSPTAKKTIEEAAARGRHVGVSAISLAEIVYLVDKGRVVPETLTRMRQALRDPEGVLTEVPMDGRVTERMSQVPRGEVPDLPDRVIAATALLFGVPVISHDRKIRTSVVRCVW